jgi:multiple sugar transport system permease protein
MTRLAAAIRATLAILTAVAILWAFGRVVSRWFRPHPAGKVQLTILHWGDKTEDEIVASLIDEFEARNPDINVIRTNTGSPAQLATKLQTMLASGEPPDLFYLDFTKVAAFASQAVLEELEPYIARDRASEAADALDLDDFFPATLDAFRCQPATGRVGSGPLVGLPKDFTCVGFYYNRNLFDQAGVPYPPNDGWTWDQFIDAARAIGRLDGCHGAEFVTWESWVRMYLFTCGLDVADPGFQRFHLSDPAVVAALDRLRSWFHDEDRTLLSAKTQLETGQAPFLTGKIGMAGPFGRWQVPLYRRITGFDWDFAPLPHAPGHQPANGVITVAWAMARNGRHKQESWRLMKFLLGRSGQELVCATGLAIPVLQSVAASPCFTDPAARPDSDDVFLAGARDARPIEWPADTRFMDELKTGFENIFKLGHSTAAEMERVQQTWEKIAAFTSAAPPMPWPRIATIAGIFAAPLIALGLLRWWRRRPGRLAAVEERAGLAMVSPWVIGFVAFCAFPIAMSLLLGFARWNPMRTVEHAEWVGLANFRELLTFDPTFRKAVIVTAWYALLAVPSSQILALIAALLLNREWRSIGVFRAIWYLPSVLAGVGMAIMWKWVFHHEHGLLNALLAPLLAPFHADPPRWFEKDAEWWGVPAFALLNLWLIGGAMMIYLAGLKGISRELYEAAEIDGAIGWRRFGNVTLPMLSPVIFFNTIMAMIASFQVFTQVFVMTGGGPGTATQFYVFYLYKKAFDLGAMGYASAMAWILLLIVLALTLLVMRGTQRFVYYEALKT